MRRADKIVAAARGMIGVPFRLHGRNGAHGLDCIGLVALALERGGHTGLGGDIVPVAYSVRGGTVARFAAAMQAAGLRRVRKARAGDLVLAQAAVAQFHLMIFTGESHVHADAGLGRVVEMPGPPPWPVIAHFRWGR